MTRPIAPFCRTKKRSTSARNRGASKRRAVWRDGFSVPFRSHFVPGIRSVDVRSCRNLSRDVEISLCYKTTFPSARQILLTPAIGLQNRGLEVRTLPGAPAFALSREIRAFAAFHGTLELLLRVRPLIFVAAIQGTAPASVPPGE